MKKPLKPKPRKVTRLTDKERLDWLTKNAMRLEQLLCSGWAVTYLDGKYVRLKAGDDPRAAIDAAILAEKKGATQ